MIPVYKVEYRVRGIILQLLKNRANIGKLAYRPTNNQYLRKIKAIILIINIHI